LAIFIYPRRITSSILFFFGKNPSKSCRIHQLKHRP